jgi:DNA-binding NarL/FixJ family response regulator
MNEAKKNIRILLVDDHKSFSDGLALLIGTRKPEMEVVGMAGSRLEALSAATQHKPDIVLLDIEMGADNGLEMLPELIEQTGAKVIILTGTQTPEVHETAILRGAQGVILKTDSGQIILKAIEKVYHGEIWISNQMSEKRRREKRARPGSAENQQPDRPRARNHPLARGRRVLDQ